MKAAVQTLEFPLYINGEWKPAISGETFDVINPATGEVVARVAKAGKEDVEQAVSSARQAFDSGVWSKKSPQERANVLVHFGNKIIEHAEELGYLESISSGATVRRISNLDIMSIVDLLQQTAKFTVEYPYVESLPTVPFPGPSNNQVWREPLGVVAAVTAWNFPMILAMWKLAPALAMGNSIIVKPASNTPLSTLKLAELAAEAGIPAGVFNVVSGPGSSIGETLVIHPSVDKIAFTGSTEVGSRIMKLASETVKRVTPELGGKSPAIVLPDADLDITIPGILFGFLTHSGQVCESGTRVLVHDSIYEKVIEQLSKVASTIKIGNPLDTATGMGPMVSKQQMETVLSYIESGIQEGARLVCGGKRRIVEGFENGFFIEPTIFADVHNDMKIAREEIFGPVLSVIRYSTVEEAIDIANDTIYGLAGGVWSKNVNKAMQIARELKAGTIWINDWHMLRSDAPFGGYKQSGFGRELGRHALDEYSQLKHVHCSLVPEVSQRSWYQILLG
ncbi:aldehyde dehydrogenase [Peribacillus simplex]|uniref:aldehyde dehydrogenase family protein n=1 Tax=Peribacillus simplex TaxID=1478 RepID=UPI002989DF06|nr:aldehyde dehydrogenase family protein [Peribacillus simplex]MBX9955399.1 aldehyde dehydrogenase [Peribacillus simplex]